jgi:hypothetical protein
MRLAEDNLVLSGLLFDIMVEMHFLNTLVKQIAKLPVV